MALAAELLGDRWTLLILREAFYGVQRYDDMRADLSASRSMLTDRLARLVDHGLMTRRAYQEPGDRMRQAYVLTPAGRDLGMVLMALSQWGETHILKGPAPIEVIDRETEQSLRVALVDEEDRISSLKNAKMIKRRLPG